MARKKVRHFAERKQEFLHESGSRAALPIVGLVGADPAFAAAIQKTLRTLKVSVREFASARAFLKEGARADFACLIIEARLPDRSGLDLYEEVARTRVMPPVVFVGENNDVQPAVRAMKAGAFAFVVKSLDGQEMLDTVQSALWQSRIQADARKIVAELERRLLTLTTREQEIMTLLVSGPRNKDIAAHIDIADGTVKAHRNQIMKKMGARSLPVLLGMAQMLGFEEATPQALVSEAFERDAD